MGIERWAEEIRKSKKGSTFGISYKQSYSTTPSTIHKLLKRLNILSGFFIMADLTISKKNEVFLTIDCEPHVQYELRDAFSFEVPGAKFHPHLGRDIGME